jgi:hypothetical protein
MLALGQWYGAFNEGAGCVGYKAELGCKLTDEEAKRAEGFERIKAEVERRVGPINAASQALMVGYKAMSEAMQRVVTEGLVPPAAAVILGPALEVSKNSLEEAQSLLSAATASLAKPTEHG